MSPLTKRAQFIFQAFQKRAIQTYADPLYQQMTIQNIEYEIQNSHVSANNFRVYYQLPVQKQLCNILNIMHGGALATLVDISTTVSICIADTFRKYPIEVKSNELIAQDIEQLQIRDTVSIDMQMNYLNALTEGETISIQTTIDKIGKSLAFSRAGIYNSKKQLSCTGAHNKFFIEKTSKL